MLLKEKIALFKSDANEVLHFRVVRDEMDVTASWFPYEFTPEMTHQVFGDSECIFGYRGLNIKYYLCATSMRTFLSIKYDEALTPDRFEGLQADDVERAIARHMSPGFFTRLDPFLEAVRNDANQKPFGSLVRAYRERVADVVTCPRTVYSLRRREIDRVPNLNGDGDSASSPHAQNGCGNGTGTGSGRGNGTCSPNDDAMAPPAERIFEIYKLTAAEGGLAFHEFHERLQTMLLFFVDAASYIDLEDDRWRFYLLYERYQTPEGSTRFALLGYMTVYEYFAYPHSLRPRVSQVLVFPPHQRAGHGTRLLQHFYDECRSRPEVLDIPGAMLMLKSSDVTVNVRVRLVIRFA